MLTPSIEVSRAVVPTGGAWFMDGPTSTIIAIASCTQATDNHVSHVMRERTCTQEQGPHRKPVQGPHRQLIQGYRTIQGSYN